MRIHAGLLRRSLPLLLACLAATQALPADNECAYALLPCQTGPDLNCDGKDVYHCQSNLDVDGATYGDCQPDGVADDLWTFYDGDFDGVIDCGNPFDFILAQADGLPDGTPDNPACDRRQEDLLQGAQGFEPVALLDATTIAVSGPVDSTFDLIRGNVANLAYGIGVIDLGPVICLEDSFPGSSYATVVDLDVPPAGEAYFYVTRNTAGFFGSGFVHPYGYGDCTERTVAPGFGDCTPD